MPVLRSRKRRRQRERSCGFRGWVPAFKSCAVSVPGGAAHVVRARAAGAHVTIEACPHHLLLNLDDAKRLRPYGRCAPPLRDRSLAEALWRYVKDETVDCLVSHHSPYTTEAKPRGNEDIFQAGVGLQAIQRSVPLTLHERNMSLGAFVRLARPARITAYYPRNGTIFPGFDADLMIVNPSSNWVVNAEPQHCSKNPWTPFEGKSCGVRVERTLVRGETVSRDGEIYASPGWGQFLPRADAGAKSERESGAVVAMS